MTTSLPDSIDPGHGPAVELAPVTLVEPGTAEVPPVQRIDALGGLIHEYCRAA
jgi:hypothetical protein